MNKSELTLSDKSLMLESLDAFISYFEKLPAVLSRDAACDRLRVLLQLRSTRQKVSTNASSLALIDIQAIFSSLDAYKKGALPDKLAKIERVKNKLVEFSNSGKLPPSKIRHLLECNEHDIYVDGRFDPFS